MSVTAGLSIGAAALVIVLILWTMPIGKRIAARLGLPEWSGFSLPGGRSSRPSRADRDYLLRVCGRDPAEVERRLAAERERFTGLPEADIYRRAIRTYMNSRDSLG